MEVSPSSDLPSPARVVPGSRWAFAGDDPGAVPRRAAQGFRGLAVGTWALLIFGATVRVNGAGLSCPDWPLCFGRVIPQLNVQVALEWGHRVLAGSISTVFIGLGGLIWLRPELRARVGRLWGGAAVVLVAQIVLGGLTVLQLLAFWSVTLHLLTGNLFLLSLLLIADRLDPKPLSSSPVTRRLAGALLAMWFIQMALGGLVSSNHAGLACTEWPTCNGGVWFPVMDGIVGLQLLHRLGAYIVFALCGALAWSARASEAALLTQMTLVVVCVQVALGITNVFLALPVEVAVLHSATGDLLGICAASTFLRVRASAAVQVAA